MLMLVCNECFANICYAYGSHGKSHLIEFGRHNCHLEHATHVMHLANLIADMNLQFAILEHSTIRKYFPGVSKYHIKGYFSAKSVEQSKIVSGLFCLH